MEDTFLDVIRMAHQEGDLSGVRVIKQALLYENYFGSSPELQGCLHDHPLWASLDATQDSPGYIAASGSGGKPPFADCALPSRWSPGAVHVARVETIERLVKRVGTPGDLRVLADARLPAATARAFFGNLCERDFSNRPLLWVFLRAADRDENPTRLLMDLGLLHALGMPGGTRYLLVDMEISARRKPTWADAGLAWYFDATPDTGDHGWTRSLVSGDRGYQEWVAKGEHVGQVVDVLQIMPDGVPEEPAQAFWDYHRNRIEAARGGHGAD